MASIIRGSDGFDSATLGLDAGNLATNGYAYLPNGLIVQWGRTSVYNNDNYYNTYFPIVFPNACLSITTNSYRSGDTKAEMYFNILGIYNNYFRGVPTASSNIYGVSWMAIGY